MTLFLEFAIRSSIILAAGLLLSAALAKHSAALRHRVLVAALVGAALVVPLSVIVPAWTVPLPSPTTTVSSPPTLLERSVRAPVSTATVPVTSREPAAPFESSWPDVTRIVLLVWILGCGVVAATLVGGLLRVRWMVARATRVDDPAWLQILTSVAARYRLTRHVVLARTDASDLLATWGALRPRVLLPRQSRDWTLDRAHVVLCHELAHIRRHDWLVQMGAEIFRAVLWFNPLVWMVCTRLRRESEQACDDEVLGAGVVGRDYAAHLLELARQCRRPASQWASALPMAHPSTLERRITAMLNPGLNRRVPSWHVLAALSVVLLLVTVPIASLRARQAGPALLTGTVYDVSGAVLPGVKVTLVDANQIELPAVTGATGRFEFPVVAPGKYLLDVTLPGFRSLRQEFELRDPADWARAVTLQVGDLRETVIVRTMKHAAASRPEPERAIRVGGNVRAPRKIKDVRPSYPASMAEAGFSGEVPIEAVIGRDGAVSSVRVVSAQVHPDFAIAAVDAVRQWQFTPTLLNGQAVEVVMTVSVTFDLQ